MSRSLDDFCRSPKTASKGGLNVDQIIDELRVRGLDTTGKRDDLVKRLCDNLYAKQAPKQKYTSTLPLPVQKKQRSENKFMDIPLPPGPKPVLIPPPQPVQKKQRSEKKFMDIPLPPGPKPVLIPPPPQPVLLPPPVPTPVLVPPPVPGPVLLPPPQPVLVPPPQPVLVPPPPQPVLIPPPQPVLVPPPVPAPVLIPPPPVPAPVLIPPPPQPAPGQEVKYFYIPPPPAPAPKQKGESKFTIPTPLNRLIYLYYHMDEPGNEAEFDKLIVLWYKSLSIAEHRNKQWIKTHSESEVVNDLYIMGQNAIIKIKPVVSVALDSLTSEKEQLGVILSYSPNRRLLYLEGPILDTLSAFVKENLEHGGMIDVNKAGIFDRAVFGIGARAAISVSDVIDYEIVFHTHPSGRTYYMFEPPSPNDGRVSMHSRLQQVHVVFTPEAVYTIYSPKAHYPQDVHDAVQAISVQNSKGGLQTYGGMIQFIEEFAKHGVYIFRYSNFKTLHELRAEPKLNWPKRIPLFIDPQEPVISLTKRGVRFNDEQKALTAALRSQSKQRSH